MQPSELNQGIENNFAEIAGLRAQLEAAEQSVLSQFRDVDARLLELLQHRLRSMLEPLEQRLNQSVERLRSMGRRLQDL